jgi:FkbM family methyltransferase
VNSSSFDSYSQNGEDVVLWRALQHVERGRYVDVGAYHPRDDSVSMAFYSHGWQGITVEPDPDLARLHREMRPRDVQVEAAITDTDRGVATLHVVTNTGLSTLDDELVDVHRGSGYETHDLEVTTRRIDAILDEAGWGGADIHFMSVDTEGFERIVLESTNLACWRPWVLVVEATEPNSSRSTRHLWDDLVVGAGYSFCLFDGLSCFFVADEHRDLAPLLSYPACVLDNYTTRSYRDQARKAEMVPTLINDVARWRTQAVRHWGNALAEADQIKDLRMDLKLLREENEQLRWEIHSAKSEIDRLHGHIDEMYGSDSWRVTKPMRAVSGWISRARSTK